MTTRVTRASRLSSPLMSEHQEARFSPLEQKTDRAGRSGLGTLTDFFKSFGGKLLNHLYMAGDTVSALKTTHDVADAIAARGVPNTSNFDTNIEGVESGGITLAVGIGDIARGTGIIQKSYKTGDELGLFSGVARGVFRGPVELVRGAGSITANSLNLANKSTSLPKLVMGIGLVGIAGGYLCSTVIAASAISSLVESRSISKALNTKIEECGNEAGFNHLKEMLSITEEDKKEVLEEIFNPKQKSWHERALNYIGSKIADKEPELDKKLKTALQNNDIDSIKELLASRETVTDTRRLSSEKQKAISRKLGSIKGYRSLDIAQKRQLIELVLGLYETGIENKKEKKETIFTRSVGLDTKKLIDKFVKQTTVVPTDENLTEIITSAKAEMTGNMRRMGWIIGACILSIIVSALGEAVTGGISTLVELAFNAVIGAIWLGIDGYYLYQAYKEDHADWRDRVLMLLATISVVVTGALATSLVKSRVTGIVITATALSVYLAVSLYQIFSWKSSSPEEPARPAESGYASHMGDVATS